jgi:uncharacterized membrane protein YfcA
MINLLLFLVLGFAAGVFSGLIGVGGGIIVVPVLVLVFGLSQHIAQGTTLAMLLPPIGILAVWEYYRQGHVDIKIAALLCAGFILGGLIGAKLATGMSSHALQRVFGIALLAISVKMIWGK